MNTIAVMPERSVGTNRIPVADHRFVSDVLLGLTREQKSIPSLWLYDQRGSELFKRLMQRNEYYPARMEIEILKRHASAIGALAGPHATVVEIGNRSSRKTAVLLRTLTSPHSYVPIDVCAEFLHESADTEGTHHPGLQALSGICIPPLATPSQTRTSKGRHVGFLSESTLGNLRPREALDVLRLLRNNLGPEALLVLGVDTTLDPATLLPAYGGSPEITAAFNTNILLRMNRELDARFDLDKFRHEVRLDERRPRIEMHLVSTATQDIKVLNRVFHFKKGESIHTANFYKYQPTEFPPLAESVGWRAIRTWGGDDGRFAVHVLAAAID